MSPERESELRQKAREFAEAGTHAAMEAIAELRERGIPIVHCINGEVVYELPSGERTREEPEMYKQARLGNTLSK